MFFDIGVKMEITSRELCEINVSHWAGCLVRRSSLMWLVWNWVC